MSLGKGYEYLLRSVARGDGAATTSSPLTRYYAESGTPPGRWLGTGLAGLNGGLGLAAGSEISEAMLFNLLGILTDPITGEPLGRRPAHWPESLSTRILNRIDGLPSERGGAEWAAAAGQIEAEERERERRLRRPVAGFDLTFSVPKSVSAVWGIADAETQAVIYQAHRDAIDRAIAYAERHVFFSRSGVNGLIQEDIRGVVAAAFDHWDSRAGDPHLHTHVVIANRAQTADGTWRTLDSRALFKYVVALSELHEGILEDLLSARLGYAWDERARRHSAVPRHDIAGVPDGLIEAFSRRSADIETAKTDLVAQFVTAHGRQPSPVEMLRLRQQATLSTRPDKQHRTLAEQTANWRDRAHSHVGTDTAGWAATLRDRNTLPALRRGDLDERMLREVAAVALATVSGRRTTFTHANVLAEVHRQLHGMRFADPDERLSVADHVTDLALDEALLLTPPQLEPPAAHLARPDGTSKLRHRGAQIYTTRELLDAESRLLDAGRTTTGPSVPASIIANVATEVHGHRHLLGPDQAAAVTAIATSGRVLDLLVGPAGTGKTTALAGLRHAWESVHGPGSVIGLAPSAAAAEVLADELGIDTENTAKWIHESRRQRQRHAQIAALDERLRATTSNPSTVLARRIRTQLADLQAEHDQWGIHPGQLVLIDEAGLAGTLALDTIVRHAAAAGAKVVLIGDPAQLCSIEAGGAFAMLVRDRDDPPELSEIRRFTSDWEREASLQLRTGDPAAIATYRAHDRIRSGERTAMLDRLYAAWRHDTQDGHTSIMIAVDRESVADLNLRARADRIAAGEVGDARVQIASGAVAGIGDRVITRHNSRRLTAGHSWVKNGDIWTVTALGDDGSLTAQREHGGALALLPHDYVRQHVDLGYAATTYRAQGRSVDTAHALIDHTTTRETLYVAATRGRHSNTIYLDTCTDPEPETSHQPAASGDVDEVLRAVLANTRADTSAHAMLAQEVARVASIDEPDLAYQHRDSNREIAYVAGATASEPATDMPDHGVRF